MVESAKPNIIVVLRSLVGYLECVVREGRSTPGPRRENDVPVDLWKGAFLEDGEENRWDA